MYEILYYSVSHNLSKEDPIRVFIFFISSTCIHSIDAALGRSDNLYNKGEAGQ